MCIRAFFCRLRHWRLVSAVIVQNYKISSVATNFTNQSSECKNVPNFLYQIRNYFCENFNCNYFLSSGFGSGVVCTWCAQQNPPLISSFLIKKVSLDLCPVPKLMSKTVFVTCSRPAQEFVQLYNLSLNAGSCAEGHSDGPGW